MTGRIDVDLTITDPSGSPWPLSYPAFYNFTVVGSTPDAGQDFTPVEPNNVNRGYQMRNGFAGELHNSISVNTGTRPGLDIDTGSGDGAPGFDVTDNIDNDLVRVVCSTFDDGGAFSTEGLDALANGDAYAEFLGGDGTFSDNSTGIASTTLLINEDQTFDPTGDGAGATEGKLVASLKPAPMDFRAAGGFPPPPTAGCPAPQGTGLDPSATYRGAFAPVVDQWTEGWTVLSIGGLH